MKSRNRYLISVLAFCLAGCCASGGRHEVFNEVIICKQDGVANNGDELWKRIDVLRVSEGESSKLLALISHAATPQLQSMTAYSRGAFMRNGSYFVAILAKADGGATVLRTRGLTKTGFQIPSKDYEKSRFIEDGEVEALIDSMRSRHHLAGE